MATVEQLLAQMTALRGMAGSAVVAGELAKFLAHKSYLVAAKAADLAREGGHAALAPQLIAAFARFMAGPAKGDPGCLARQAIVNALYELDAPAEAEATFLAGIKLVQKEATYGKPVDTAAETRGLSALGLVRMGYRDVMPLLVELLTDEERAARILAARAIAYAGRDDGALLLRLKIRVGDVDSGVTGECLVALANLSRVKALSFIRPYLSSGDAAIAESAALALGEMRDAAALDVLIDQWRRDRGQSTRHALLLPIAIARLPKSVDVLLDVVATESEGLATAAVEALAIFRHDDAIRGRVDAAVQARKLDRLTARFDKLFNG